MAIFEDSFNYPDGDLNSQGNWTAHANFDVVSNHVEYVTGDANYAYGTLDIATDKNILIFQGLIGFNATAYGSLQVELSRGTGNPIAGIYLEARTDPNYYDLNYATGLGGYTHITNIPRQDGVLVPFKMIINRSTGAYTEFSYNNIDYAPKTFSNTAGDITRIQIYANYGTGVYPMFDTLSLSLPDKMKYNKFPRWQKTKYGMRPCY